MANYRSYRQIRSDQISSGSIDPAKLQSGVAPRYCVKMFYGHPCYCTPGCCCNWSVPSGVEKLTIELWGAGGNGHGACSCNRCQHYRGASGGAYNTKTISTSGGCQYRVCAGGVYRCCSRECNGCNGCSSYVNGYNLSNFCAHGGARGCANPDWTVRCTSTNWCCVSPGTWGGDFAMAPHQKGWSGHWNCHCTGAVTNEESSGAPFLSTNGVEQMMEQCWIRCGCWTAPYATGGQGAMTTYCGRCCGQGGQGGSGMVRITYV